MPTTDIEFYVDIDLYARRFYGEYHTQKISTREATRRLKETLISLDEIIETCNGFIAKLGLDDGQKNKILSAAFSLDIESGSPPWGSCHSHDIRWTAGEACPSLNPIPKKIKKDASPSTFSVSMTIESEDSFNETLVELLLDYVYSLSEVNGNMVIMTELGQVDIDTDARYHDYDIEEQISELFKICAVDGVISVPVEIVLPVESLVKNAIINLL